MSSLASSLLSKPLKAPTGAAPAWMKTQVATELLKHVKTSGNQIWLGATSAAEDGFLLGWNSFEAAAAEFSSMARLTLAGDEGKAAVFFVPAPEGAGLAVGVARPAHLPSLAQRLFTYRFLSTPCPSQGRFPVVTPSLAQLLYQSVQAAVLYTAGLPSRPSYVFTLGFGGSAR